MVRRFHIVLLAVLMMVSCSSPALHEAQRVVAQADSMREEGRMYDDSLALAQAYGTLEQWSWFHADEYAHSCYHYGRLLREKDKPVEAMQCFISATHAPTRDYYILGRVYSNMGDIAHLAGEFALAYDMYERSAEMYLHNGDTLLYNYGLYSMAFELAEQGKEEETFAILQKIRQECAIRDVLSLADYTQAVLYKNTERYDSAIYYAQRAQTCLMCYADAILITAQSYSYLGAKDSAVYYANLVVASSTKLYHINNALYILTNDDEESNKETIRETAADRADAQKLLEIRQGKLAQAAQLLEQDLHRQPDWSGYVMLMLLLASAIGAVVLTIIWKKRKQQMQVLTDEQANNIVESIKKHVDTKDLNTTLRWKNYDELKTEADLYMGGIVSKLETYHLNEVEIRFCILTLLDFPLKKIADTIYYSYPSAIKTLKKRIADKLSTTPPELKNFLLHLPPKL